MNKVARYFSSTLCTVGMAVTVAHGAPADLDATWGNGGIAIVSGAGEVHDGRLASGGGLVLSLPYSQLTPHKTLIRLAADGDLDMQFGDQGFRRLFCGDACLVALDVTPDGRILTMLSARPVDGGLVRCNVEVQRYVANGLHDPAFASGSAVFLRDGGCGNGSVATDASGQAFFPLINVLPFGPTAFATAWITHLDTTGMGRPELGSMTANPPPLERHYGRIAAYRDGRPVVAAPGLEQGFAVMRFANGVPDPAFGNGGLALAASGLPVKMGPVVVTPDDKVVVGGIAERGGGWQVALARFTHRGDPDLQFGAQGVAFVELTKPGEGVVEVELAVLQDGRIVVGASVGGGDPRISIARLLPNGSLDFRFAGGGITDLWTKAGTVVRFVAVRPTGQIVVGGNSLLHRPSRVASWFPVVFQLQGGDLPASKPLRERTAIEYFHAGSGHYFVTADQREIVSLDVQMQDWQRTGQRFKVFDGGDPSLVPVCRFWSGQSFAPKSSHFYTPYTAECVGLKSGNVWQYEGDTFYVRMPEGPQGGRTCPVATQPLYRAYNNGLSGAPSHRYTIDVALLDQMVEQGWTFEGDAQTKVFACVPAL